MSNKDGMSGGLPLGAVRGRRSSGPISAAAAIKIAQSAAELAKMGFKVVPIPGKKKK
jgi:hypothetical protein